MSTGSIVDGKIVIGKQGGEGVGFPGAGDDTSSAKESKSKKQKKIRVMINQQDGPDGKFDVPIGVNGKVLLIKRGEEVEIPEEYFFVLRDAKVDQLVRNPGEEEQIITMSRFSYNVLGEVN